MCSRKLPFCKRLRRSPWRGNLRRTSHHRFMTARPTIPNGWAESDSLLVEQIGLLADNQVPKRLILEPGHARVADLLPRHQGSLVRDRYWLPGGLGQQLRLAAAIHRDI